MKRILKWLESKFSQRSAAERHTPVGVTTKENVKEEYSASDCTPTIPNLTILRESSFEASDSTGDDPYNSGSFDKSKAWK